MIRKELAEKIFDTLKQYVSDNIETLEYTSGIVTNYTVFSGALVMAHDFQFNGVDVRVCKDYIIIDSISIDPIDSTIFDILENKYITKRHDTHERKVAAVEDHLKKIFDYD